jgi:hypothetical protein
MNPGSRFFLNVRVKSLFLPLGDIIYLKFYFLFLFFYSYSIILYRSYKKNSTISSVEFILFKIFLVSFVCFLHLV